MRSTLRKIVVLLVLFCSETIWTYVNLPASVSTTEQLLRGSWVPNGWVTYRNGKPRGGSCNLPFLFHHYEKDSLHFLSCDILGSDAFPYETSSPAVHYEWQDGLLVVYFADQTPQYSTVLFADDTLYVDAVLSPFFGFPPNNKTRYTFRRLPQYHQYANEALLHEYLTTHTYVVQDYWGEGRKDTLAFASRGKLLFNGVLKTKLPCWTTARYFDELYFILARHPPSNWFPLQVSAMNPDTITLREFFTGEPVYLVSLNK